MKLVMLALLVSLALLLGCAGNSSPPAAAPPAQNPYPAAPAASAPSAASPPSAPAPPPATLTIKISQNSNLGPILTDGSGLTLYVFTKDEINTSTCYGPCAAKWPALLAPNGKVSGSLPGQLGTAARSDGSLQATYNGMPLYYWSGDKMAGEVYGQGVLGVWFAAMPNMTGFPRSMSAKEAMAAARQGCLAAGNLTNRSAYDNATQTWSIDLDASQSGCTSKCVVYSQNKSTSVIRQCAAAPVPAIVKTAQTPTFSMILTDGAGMALYVFINDKAGQPTCYGICAGTWPPLLTASGNVSGSLPGRLGTVARTDGTWQVTYNGMPLYHYAPDSGPGVVYGNGYNNLWFVAQPSMTTFPTPPPMNYGGGGGY